MNVTPKVSIIIVNYNGLTALGSLLHRCLESVLSTDYPNFEVIFVDNASNDNSVAYVEKSFSDSRLKLLKLATNRLYLGGLEEGARAADEDSKYLVFMNNDVVVTSSWLKELIEVMEGDEGVGIACPSVLNFDGSIQCTAFYVDRFLFYYIWAERSMNETLLASAPSGPVYVIRRSLLKDVNIFDENLAIYGEELIVGHEVWTKGFKIVVVPRDVVYHAGNVTLSRYNNPMLIFHSHKNDFYLLFKFGDALSILLGLLLRLARLPILMVGWAKAKRPVDFIIYLQVMWWLFKNGKEIERHKKKGMFYLSSRYAPLLVIYMTTCNRTWIGKRIYGILARAIRKTEPRTC